MTAMADDDVRQAAALEQSPAPSTAGGGGLAHPGPTADAPVLDYVAHYRRAEQWLATAETEHAAGRFSPSASAARLATAHATIAATAPPAKYVTGDGGTTGRFGAHGEVYEPDYAGVGPSEELRS